MSVTMKWIAELAGVDISTVSRALNDEDSISADVKARIVKIAEENNYRKRKLKTDRIIYIIDKRFFLLTNRFYNGVIAGIEDEARERGFEFVFQSLNPDQFSINHINTKNLAGMIITSCYHDDFILEAKKTGLPIVLVDYYLRGNNVSAVLIDNTDGVIMGMRYLSSLGHRRVAYLTGDLDEIGGGDRFSGYKTAVGMFGMAEEKSLIIKSDFSIQGAYGAMKKFLAARKDYPTAVFAVNDMVAIGAMEAIKEKGLAIPGDMAVLGFDDIDLAAEVIPSLSTMHVRKKTMGSLAVRRLLESMRNENPEYGKILVPPVFIERESTIK